jgi:hypothetical protein
MTVEPPVSEQAHPHGSHCSCRYDVLILQGTVRGLLSTIDDLRAELVQYQTTNQLREIITSP